MKRGYGATVVLNRLFSAGRDGMTSRDFVAYGVTRWADAIEALRLEGFEIGERPEWTSGKVTTRYSLERLPSEQGALFG